MHIWRAHLLNMKNVASHGRKGISFSLIITYPGIMVLVLCINWIKVSQYSYIGLFHNLKAGFLWLLVNNIYMANPFGHLLMFLLSWHTPTQVLHKIFSSNDIRSHISFSTCLPWLKGTPFIIVMSTNVWSGNLTLSSITCCKFSGRPHRCKFIIYLAHKIS